MVVPPMPWYSPNQGGYYLRKSQLLRLKDTSNEQRILVDNTHPSNMYPIYDSLNALSACPWRINKPVLDLVIKIFVNNGSKELDVPQPASEGPELPHMQKLVSIINYRF